MYGALGNSYHERHRFLPLFLGVTTTMSQMHVLVHV